MAAEVVVPGASGISFGLGGGGAGLQGGGGAALGGGGRGLTLKRPGGPLAGAARGRGVGRGPARPLAPAAGFGVDSDDDDAGG